jgi:ribosome-associated protein
MIRVENINRREKTFQANAPMNPFVLTGAYVTLAQAVKAVGLAGSGGQAKHLVRAGGVTVNGAAETQPGRKLYPGDRFGAADGTEWLVSR